MSIPKKKFIKFSFNGQILPGSVSPSFLKCGKKNCACALKENPKLHGPYFRWSGFIDNKKVTITLNNEVAQEAIKRISNYKKLLRKIELIKKISLKNAPWIIKK